MVFAPKEFFIRKLPTFLLFLKTFSDIETFLRAALLKVTFGAHFYKPVWQLED
jgi:hypothetical protein